MLKGHVFKKQIFGNQIFALFINTFLNGRNGVSDNYKNGMNMSYSGNSLTIQSGAVCIQGRFLEEDSSTDIVCGTDSAYCKLVIEIDLDKQNTDSDFVQGNYKIVKSTNSYPNLTQNNIVKNNSGIYQYELARFRSGSNGISEFQDMRTFLNFDNIYDSLQTEYRTILNQLQQELLNVEDGSAYVLKNNLVQITGIIENVSGESETTKTITFPNGFNENNCAVLSFGIGRTNNSINYGQETQDAGATFNGNPIHFIKINSNGITIHAIYDMPSLSSKQNLYYKIILFKI